MIRVVRGKFSKEDDLLSKDFDAYSTEYKKTFENINKYNMKIPRNISLPSLEYNTKS